MLHGCPTGCVLAALMALLLCCPSPCQGSSSRNRAGVLDADVWPEVGGRLGLDRAR